MKTIKKINFSIWAIALALGLIFTQSAFKSSGKKTDITWVFTQSVSDDMLDYQNYSLTALPSIDCDEDSALPCKLKLDSTINSPSKLATYLTTHSESQVLDQAVGRVPSAYNH